MATLNPLTHYKGIIYVIQNTVNNKRYIGKTIYHFTRRYRGGKWWEYTNNPHLKRAAQKYGVDAFSVTILEHSKTREELTELEQKYAIEYNSYSPNGYNLVKCGADPKQHPSSVEKRSKTVVLNNPEGKDVTITNIRAFCRLNSLDQRAIFRVLKGDITSHKGWSKEGVTDKHFRNQGKYIVYDKQETKYEITNLTKWCKEHNLCWHSMRSLVQGKIYESQGYVLNIEDFKKQRNRYVVTLTNGKEDIILKSIKRDCRAFNLHSPRIYKLISGEIKSYKGWTIKRLDLEII